MTRARTLADYVNAGDELALKAPLASPTFTGTTTVSGDLVPATPLSNRNMIINGGMQISQRGTSSTGVGASSNVFPTVDRWKVYAGNSAGRLTMSQSTDAPDGFGNSVKFDCTTADTSTAVNEEFIVTQPIEGYNLQQMAKGTSGAKAVTLSFYAKGTAKTYGWEFVDHDTSGQRHIANTFTVTTSWQRFSFVIPADTTGAFGNDANASASVYFWLLAGSNMTSGTKATAWQALAATERAVGIDNFFDNTSNELFITGVQLELGSSATPFEYRSFSDELDRCQRYYQKSFKYETVPAHGEDGRYESATPYTTSGPMKIAIDLQKNMRGSPAVTFYATSSSASGSKISSHDGSWDHNGTVSLTNAGQDGQFSFEAWHTGANTDETVLLSYNYVAEKEL